MEAEVRKEYPDSTVVLITGKGGIFDVLCNGKVIYSKHDSEKERFPYKGEISALIGRNMD